MAEPGGSTAAAWLAGPDATFEEALLVGRKEAEEAAAALPSLPRRDASRYLPVTASDAVSLVHAREDAKKKNAGNKVSKVKQKQGAAALFGPDGRVPGAAQGGGDPGAFWLYVEDFFRDTTQEDLHEILSLMAPPEEDPAFTVGPPGSGAEVPPPPKRAAEPPPPPPPPPPALGSIGVAGEGGAPADEALLGLLERRSSRLVSRLGRGGSAVARFLDGDDSLPDTEDEAAPQENKAASAATAAAAAAAAMCVPTTAAGVPAASLWEVVPGDRLALLALQLGELAEAAGAGGGKPLPAGARSAAAAAAAGRRVLSAAETAQIAAWVEARAGELSKALHCTQDVALLGLRRRVAADREGSDADGDGDDAGGAAPADGFPPPTTMSLPFSGKMHPYTRLVLASRVPPHVQASAGEAHGLEPAPAPGKTPTAEVLAGAGAGGDEGGADPATAAGSADGRGGGGGGDTAATSAAAGQPTPTATAANSSMGPTEPMDGDEAGDEEATGGGSASRPGSGRASARQRGVSNYALLAGKKDPAKAAAAAAQRKLIREATAAAAALQAASHPVSLAVASAVAAGAPDDEVDPSVPAQWAAATADPAVLAAAPQDELAAETVALQAELAAVAAANRASLTAALRGLLADLPRQAEGAAARAAEEAQVVAYYTRLREEKKKELKQRREAAHREALVAAGAQKGGALGGAAFAPSPRPTLGHHLPVDGDGGDDIGGTPFLGAEDLYDVLAARGEDDEAFCAVCGDGHSEAPNAIIFCDRCDVAVHQICYDVAEVPETEWLCWPCREYEAAQRAAGVPQADIRPPHALPDERRRLRGGARDAKCALCPIRCGAFRRTANGQQWVHPTCALWHDECFLRPGPQAAVVEGLNKIPTKRWQTACDICGRVDGAVINCRHPGTCQYNFHVLCARNCGLYLTVRPDGPRRAQYRVYCAQHSRAQQEKDAAAATKRAEGEQRAAVAAAERASKARRKEEAMVALATREEELEWLRRVRFNLESARVLADQCKRRERLKKALAAGTAPLHAERLHNPLAALAFLSKLEEMEAAGATPGQQLAAVPELEAAAGPPPPPPPPSEAPAPLAPPPAEEPAPDGGSFDGDATPMEEDPDAEPSAAAADAAADAAAAERRSARNAGKRGRDDGDGGTGTGAAPSPAASSPLLSDGGPQAKRPRGGGAATAAPSRSGTAPAIERQRLMSSAEARDINSKLPPKFKYIPVDQLAGVGGGGGGGPPAPEDGPTNSARARRAAARDAVTVGSSPAGPSPAPSETAGADAGAGGERPHTRRAAARN